MNLFQFSFCYIVQRDAAPIFFLYFIDDRKSTRAFGNEYAFLMTRLTVIEIIIAAKSIVDRILLLYGSLNNNVENPWLLQSLSHCYTKEQVL